MAHIGAHTYQRTTRCITVKDPLWLLRRAATGEFHAPKPQFGFCVPRPSNFPLFCLMCPRL